MGAWIETKLEFRSTKFYKVAPYVGAWIETEMADFADYVSSVAPYVGAWIETPHKPATSLAQNWSHPTWVRGLKPLAHSTQLKVIKLSHPTWVRGLKLASRFRKWQTLLSHPTWVRGLKHSITQRLQVKSVAPYVGAWIETQRVITDVKSPVGRTLRGCVD